MSRIKIAKNVAVDYKYLSLLSSSLDRFRWVDNPNKANFRCPICGDSKKSARKARGFAMCAPDKQMYFVKCHNCGYSKPLSTFIKDVDEGLYQQYLQELLSSAYGGDETNGMLTAMPKKKKPPEASVMPPLSKPLKKSKKYEHLVCVESLDAEHPAVVYLRTRKIPKNKYSHIFYTDNFQDFVSKDLGMAKYAARGRLPNDKRVVFLMKKGPESKSPFAIQGRRISDRSSSAHRYITIKMPGHDQTPKIWGMDRINKNRPVFIFEGIMDALFVPNSIAICGGDVPFSVLRKVLSGVPQENIYICLDNEPRHKDTLNRMQEAIESGYKVTFWSIKSSFKDINNMILGGYTSKDILKDIAENSFSGSKARLKFSVWKRLRGNK